TKQVERTAEKHSPSGQCFSVFRPYAAGRLSLVRGLITRENRMFIWLLVVTLAVSAAVCFFATRFFDKPIGSILARIVSEELGSAWHRYVTFAIYVVGISGGGRIWALERYITPNALGETTV